MSESHGMSKASGIALRNARPDTAQHRSVLAHIPELDGLRAIAVILVITILSITLTVVRAVTGKVLDRKSVV